MISLDWTGQDFPPFCGHVKVRTARKLQFCPSDSEMTCSFSPLPRNDESVDFQSDLRMTYCAAVISDLLQDQTALSVATATRYIGDCCVSAALY